jgi:hypothetical protein
LSVFRSSASCSVVQAHDRQREPASARSPSPTGCCMARSFGDDRRVIGRHVSAGPTSRSSKWDCRLQVCSRRSLWRHRAPPPHGLHPGHHVASTAAVPRQQPGSGHGDLDHGLGGTVPIGNLVAGPSSTPPPSPTSCFRRWSPSNAILRPLRHRALTRRPPRSHRH